MKNLFYIILAFHLSNQSAFSQDLHFSNINSMNQQVFPEFAGLNNDLEATVYYRSQWKSLGSKFSATGASFASTLQPKHKFSGSHLAAGLNFYHEQMSNDASGTSVRMTVVRHQAISSISKLSLGINVGIQSLSFDPASGIWGSQHDGLQYDPNLASGEVFNITQKTGLDLGAGIIYSLNHRNERFHLFQIGISGQHLNRPNISFYGDREGVLPIKIVGFSSLNLKIGKKGSMLQSTLLIQNQHSFSSVVFGSFVKINLIEKAKTTSSFAAAQTVFLGLGFHYRTTDAFIASVMIQKTTWNVSLAYDFTTSQLSMANSSKGAFELQCQFTIPTFRPTSRF